MVFSFFFLLTTLATRSVLCTGASRDRASYLCCSACRTAGIAIVETVLEQRPANKVRDDTFTTGTVSSAAIPLNWVLFYPPLIYIRTFFTRSVQHVASFASSMGIPGGCCRKHPTAFHSCIPPHPPFLSFPPARHIARGTTQSQRQS